MGEDSDGFADVTRKSVAEGGRESDRSAEESLALESEAKRSYKDATFTIIGIVNVFILATVMDVVVASWELIDRSGLTSNFSVLYEIMADVTSLSKVHHTPPLPSPSAVPTRLTRTVRYGGAGASLKGGAGGARPPKSWVPKKFTRGDPYDLPEI